jgi:hypothetical protein
MFKDALLSTHELLWCGACIPAFSRKKKEESGLMYSTLDVIPPPAPLAASGIRPRPGCAARRRPAGAGAREGVFLLVLCCIIIVARANRAVLLS